MAFSISGNAVGFDNIVGLEELNDVLYGVDTANNMLVTIDIDDTSASYGVATVVGSLNTDDLIITGLTVNPDGDGLIVLHDQPDGVTDNLLNDALYNIDITTGQATLRDDLAGDSVRRLPSQSETLARYRKRTPLPEATVLIGM